MFYCILLAIKGKLLCATNCYYSVVHIYNMCMLEYFGTQMCKSTYVCTYIQNADIFFIQSFSNT